MRTAAPNSASGGTSIMSSRCCDNLDMHPARDFIKQERFIALRTIVMTTCSPHAFHATSIKAHTASKIGAKNSKKHAKFSGKVAQLTSTAFASDSYQKQEHQCAFTSRRSPGMRSAAMAEMSKAHLIRLLDCERCSIDEIQVATGCTRHYIVDQLGLVDYPRRRPGPARGTRPPAHNRRNTA